MVCSIGSARMAVMARLLAAGSFSQSIAEKVAHQKLVAQYIYRELHEADEANLLDEEDMHVFELKPLADPLHLVCCNACKKPVKASQYAAHAELCRSLHSTGELFSELDGGAWHKKTQRKDRKKPVTAGNLVTSIGTQERCVTIGASDAAASDYHLDERARVTTFVSVEGRDCPVGANLAATLDSSVVNPTGNSVAVMMPPTKRSKSIAGGVIQSSGGIVITESVSNLLCSQKPFTYVPAPLATKVYYSQRNDRLRAALNHMYHHGAQKRGPCGDRASPKVSEGNVAARQGSSPVILSHEQLHDQSEKRYRQFSPSAEIPDQKFAQISEAGLGWAGGCQPPGNYSDPFPVNDVLTSQRTAGVMRDRYISKPHSHTVVSGTPLSTIQQPNGSVPVI